MAKPTGFLEYTRKLPDQRAPKDRVEDYKEFVTPWTEEERHEQSARCMDCGVPFCQSGCPLGNIIPEFNDAVYKKDWKEAYSILASTNNFPEFTGRVCPAPCESACVLGINQPPVAIEEIEKHIAEVAFEKNFVAVRKPETRTGKKVAVVGSGPAGMAAAAQLNYAGHEVTLYERADEIGGLLRYGIPDFKLEKTVVERRVKLMEEEGVKMVTNCNVGEDVSIEELEEGFDAIVLAGGSTIPRDLKIPGRELKGVHFAMDFLTQQNRRVSGKSVEEEDILATGKNVVVIGGGDTGSDCVGTSNRQKAKNILQLELMPKPPSERTEHMPWPMYPMTLKTTSSHKEGAVRQWAVSTKEFVSDGNGNLKALKVVDIEWKFDADGKLDGFNEKAGSEREIPCELCLLAMGFIHPQHQGLLDTLDIEYDNRGNVRAQEGDYQTSRAKVFAAGDMRRGQSLVVWAISEGRECAAKVDEYLMGSTDLQMKDHSMLELR